MRNGEADADPGAGVVELSPSDLPAHCPNPAMPLWSSHPRVFLDVVNERETICPYCSTRYRLKRSRPIEGSRFDASHLHQNREPPVLHPAAGSPAAGALDVGPREAPNLAADAPGNTTAELMTRWFKPSR